MSRPSTAPDKAREYETIYILRPDVDAESAERVADRMSQSISGHKGRLTKVELWGRRKLAYAIAKRRRGVYVYMKYLGAGETVAEVERSLRLSDDVLRFQTVFLRNDVPLTDVQVNADDVRFERVELPPLEEEASEAPEVLLGFAGGGHHDARVPDEEVAAADDAAPDADKPADAEGGN